MTRPCTPAATILVVDDFDDIRQTLRALLESRGFNVLEARDGREAVAVATAEQPDLILMDLFMPKQDGFTAAREIRQVAELRELPIVAVSAYGELGIEDQLRRRSHGAGFNEYVAKPFNADLLLELIERLLSSQS